MVSEVLTSGRVRAEKRMTAEAVAVCLRGCLSKQEEAEKWYRGLSVANRCRLWDRLHGKGALEPIKECVFALALSAFEDLVAREEEEARKRQRNENGGPSNGESCSG